MTFYKEKTRISSQEDWGMPDVIYYKISGKCSLWNAVDYSQIEILWIFSEYSVNIPILQWISHLFVQLVPIKFRILQLQTAH